VKEKSQPSSVALVRSGVRALLSLSLLQRDVHFERLSVAQNSDFHNVAYLAAAQRGGEVVRFLTV